MATHDRQDEVEWTIGPHARRQGWQVIKISFDWYNEQHMQDIRAALRALNAAHGAAQESAERSAS